MMLSSRVSEFNFLASLDSDTWLDRWLDRVLTYGHQCPLSMHLLELELCSSLCITYIGFAFLTCSMLASVIYKSDLIAMQICKYYLIG